MTLAQPSFRTLYSQLKKLAKANLAGDAVTDLISQMTLESHAFLRTQAEIVDLRSQVPLKQYFSYKGQQLSRPINKELYVLDPSELQGRLTELASGRLAHLQGVDATRTLYTIAMAFCAANDTIKAGDKKTPATYFEIVMGHMLAVHLGVSPTNSIQVLSGDLEGSLPTDFIFDLGDKKPKFHVPIKLSTRERVIQVWAHQRVLDGVHGVGRYKGLLIVLTETKLDQKTLQVVEICLPYQWRLYQMFIAQLTRIYYLDIPARYAELAVGYPAIEVKPFGYFFSEAERL